jgi:hypothetical protein
MTIPSTPLSEPVIAAASSGSVKTAVLLAMSHPE